MGSANINSGSGYNTSGNIPDMFTPGAKNKASTEGSEAVYGLPKSSLPAPDVLSQDFINLLQQLNRNLTNFTPPPTDPSLPAGYSAEIRPAQWLSLGIAAKLAIIMSEIAKSNIEQNLEMSQYTIQIMIATREIALTMQNLQKQMTSAQVELLKADATKAWAAMGTAIASAVATGLFALISYRRSDTAQKESRENSRNLGLDKDTTERLSIEAASRSGKMWDTVGQVIEKGINAIERGMSAHQDDRKADKQETLGTAEGLQKMLESTRSALEKTLQALTEDNRSISEKLNSLFAMWKEIQQLETQITRQG